MKQITMKCAVQGVSIVQHQKPAKRQSCYEVLLFSGETPFGKLYPSKLSEAIDFEGKYKLTLTALGDNALVEKGKPATFKIWGNIESIDANIITRSSNEELSYRAVKVTLIDEFVEELDNQHQDVTVLAELILSAKEARGLIFGQSVLIEVEPA